MGGGRFLMGESPLCVNSLNQALIDSRVALTRAVRRLRLTIFFQKRTPLVNICGLKRSC